MQGGAPPCRVQGGALVARPPGPTPRGCVKLKVFTLRLEPGGQAFDDSSLVEFLADREALSVHEHFFVQERIPTWALLVSYRDLPSEGPGRTRQRQRDWWAELAEDERPAFEALRRWRSERAKREGKPPYLLLTNQQMFAIARSRPATLSSLTEIKGIGAGKAGGFGEEILALLTQVGAGGGEGGEDAGGEGAGAEGGPDDGDP